MCENLIELTNKVGKYQLMILSHLSVEGGDLCAEREGYRYSALIVNPGPSICLALYIAGMSVWISSIVFCETLIRAVVKISSFDMPMAR